MTDITVLLRGPLANRHPLLGLLGRHQVNLTELHSERDSHGFPDDDPTQGWITCRTADLDRTVALCADAGWRLVAHWNTPACRVCGGGGLRPGTVSFRCDHCGGSGYTNVTPPSAERRLQEELDRLRARLDAAGIEEV